MLIINRYDLHSKNIIKFDLKNKVTIYDFNNFVKIMNYCYKNKMKFYLICDLKNIKNIPLHILIKFSKFMKQNYENNKNSVMLSGMLVKGSLLKDY